MIRFSFFLKRPLSILCIWFSLSSGAFANRSPAVIVSVDDTVITERDLIERKRLMQATGQLKPLSAEELNAVNAEIVQQLINEALVFNEAKRLKITLDANEKKRVKSNAFKNLHLSPSDAHAFFTKIGVPEEVFIRQVEGELIWSKIMNTQIRPKVYISERDLIPYFSHVTTPETKVQLRQLRIATTATTQDAYYQNLQHIRPSLAGCASFDKAVRRLPLSAPYTIETIEEKAGHLERSLQGVVLGLPIGYPSQVLRSAEALRIVMVCKRDNEEQGTREKIMDHAFERQVMQKSNVYLAKLRQQAYIRFH